MSELLVWLSGAMLLQNHLQPTIQQQQQQQRKMQRRLQIRLEWISSCVVLRPHHLGIDNRSNSAVINGGSRFRQCSGVGHWRSSAPFLRCRIHCCTPDDCDQCVRTVNGRPHIWSRRRW